MTPWQPKCTRCRRPSLEPLPAAVEALLDGGGEDVEATHECRECHNRQRVTPPADFVLERFAG